MSDDEVAYTITQVQAMIQADIQNKMKAWCQLAQDEKSDPITEQPSANVLMDANFKKLLALLEKKGGNNEEHKNTPKYTGIVQGVDKNGKLITY